MKNAGIPGWQVVLAHQHWAARALRFAGIGAVNAMVFALTTGACVRLFGVAPVIASVVGYLVAVPVGFIGHRQWSFRATGPAATQAWRFALVQLGNIVLTAGAMAGATGRLQLGWVWGIVGAIVLVPVVHFLIAHFWIFPHESPAQP